MVTLDIVNMLALIWLVIVLLVFVVGVIISIYQDKHLLNHSNEYIKRHFPQALNAEFFYSNTITIKGFILILFVLSVLSILGKVAAVYVYIFLGLIFVWYMLKKSRTLAFTNDSLIYVNNANHASDFTINWSDIEKVDIKNASITTRYGTNYTIEKPYLLCSHNLRGMFGFQKTEIWLRIDHYHKLFGAKMNE